MELRWAYVPPLVALAAAHYVLAAIALRAVAGTRLPLRDTVMTQFTAAAANRVTPSGLGGSAVNVRFLTCHGLPLRTAITAVAAMHVLGGLADLPMVVAVSPWAGREVVGRLYGAVADPRVLTIAGAGAAVATVVALCRRSRGGRGGRGDRWADARTGVARLLRRPRDLVVLMVASAATTLSLGVAFALSVLAVPGAAEPAQAGVLIGAYLIGGSVSGLVPVPAGLGSTEAVLVAALATLDVAAGPAVQSVLLFRVITHWAPAPLGLFTARRALFRSRRRDSALPGESAFTAP
ncbi:MAG TPA: lysylphosphatidylglycerol synthase transmembrane domain-containing protein [Streptosporangiaceae bacterium]|nr:lysylphosphatidylglycerol synthase transmembrane domain-containing protein [Streptosporangiaceae bacterium]